MLFTGTALVLLCLAMFINSEHRPLSLQYFAWLFLLGVSLGFTLSVKWVGLFSVALVGLYTVKDLYEMLGNRGLSLVRRSCSLSFPCA